MIEFHNQANGAVYANLAVNPHFSFAWDREIRIHGLNTPRSPEAKAFPEKHKQTRGRNCHGSQPNRTRPLAERSCRRASNNS